jgi:hypothetical protein
LRERVRVDVGEHELHAERRALHRELSAETAAAAGDHSNLAFELIHALS